MRFFRQALVITLAALALCAASSAPAGAAEHSTPPVTGAAAVLLDDGHGGPAARAACPFCVFAAGAAIRAAIAIRAAAAARAIVVAAAAARASAKILVKVTRTKVRRVQREARKISKRGKKWVRRNWGTLKAETQACLATVAFMESKGYLRDRLLTRNEWSQYAIFGPRLVSPVETLEIAFPIRFDPKEIASKAADEAVECAFGMAAGKYFAKNEADRPHPE
jgi:hypothetical protein